MKNVLQVGRLIFMLIVGVGIGRYGSGTMALAVLGLFIGWFISYEDVSYQYKKGHKKYPLG